MADVNDLTLSRLRSAPFTLRRAGNPLAALAALILCSCGGSSGSTPTSELLNQNQPTTAMETGAYTAIVRIPNSPAVVALFPDGEAYYSPDGYNLGGGGATIAAYGGTLTVTQIVPVGSGVEALMSDGSAYLSPDGTNLGGGGSTQVAYKGEGMISSLVPVGTGVDVVFGNNGPAYFSPDGLNLAGGGKTVKIYAGGVQILQIVPVGPGDGVVTLLANGTAYYSPDNSNLGGGGNTVSASNSNFLVQRLVPVSGGVLAQFNSGSVYLSPNGQNLDGGGHTVGVADWTAEGNAPFAPRDSAHGAIFLGHAWVSGGYTVPTNSDSCFLTCSYFDLWRSSDDLGLAWDATASFQTASEPNPRDIIPVVNNGVQDDPVPTDFYDSYSSLAVWNGELTAIGTTVWRSADGVHWARNNQPDGTALPGPVTTQATENSRALILGSTLYFLKPETAMVYSSTDANAATWTALGAIPNFAPRCGAAAFVLHGKMWIVGGGACDYSQIYNDVWSSSDGVNWTQSTTANAWPGRMWPCAATSGDGVVWLVGGYAPTDYNNAGGTITRRYGANHADLWYSKNGTDWKQFKADVGTALSDNDVFEPRHAPTCFVAGPETSLKLVIVAGTGGTNPDAGQDRPLNSIRSVSLPFAATLP